MVEEYLTLLQEALDQLVEMHKVADSSVADYILQIETAVQFIDKALKTEDRLDIFRALQKAYDALKKEYDETPKDELYDDLVDRLETALKGLQEGVFVKKSTLKEFTKFVLKEIAINPGQGGSKFTSIQQMMPAMMSIIKKSGPYTNSIKEGHKQAYKMLGNMVNDFKILTMACLKNNNRGISKAKRQFAYDSELLVDILIQWAATIYKEEQTKKNEIDAAMELFTENFNVMSIQGKEMFNSIKSYQNYIKASEEADRVNESFSGMRKAIDSLFKIGLDIGYDERKMVGKKKGEINWPDTPFTIELLVSQNPHISQSVIRKSLETALGDKSVSIKGKIKHLGKGKTVLVFIKNK